MIESNYLHVFIVMFWLNCVEVNVRICSQQSRAVNKIASCQVNTSQWKIKQLEISFGSIFLLFSHEIIWG